MNVCLTTLEVTMSTLMTNENVIMYSIHKNHSNDLFDMKEFLIFVLKMHLSFLLILHPCLNAQGLDSLTSRDNDFLRHQLTHNKHVDCVFKELKLATAVFTLLPHRPRAATNRPALFSHSIVEHYYMSTQYYIMCPVNIVMCPVSPCVWLYRRGLHIAMIYIS